MSEPQHEDSATEHQVIGTVLKVHLAHEAGASGSTLLPQYSEDARHLSLAMLDVALMERIAMPFPAERSPFDYLVRCYTRAMECGAAALARRIALFSNLALSEQQLLAAQALAKSRKTFMRLLCADAKRNRALPSGFVKAMVEDGGGGDDDADVDWVVDKLGEMLTPPKSPEQVAAAMRGVLALLNSKAAARALVRHKMWRRRVPSLPGIGKLAELTFLGTALNTVCTSLAAIRTRTQTDANAWASGESALTHAVQTQVHAAVTRLLVCGPQCTRAVVEVLAFMIDANKQRAQMRFDSRTVASDIFFLNLSGVLLNLSKPIVEANKKGTNRMHMIQLCYSVPQPSSANNNNGVLLDYTDTTRLGMSPAQLKELLISSSVDFPDKYNFVTEMFFMCSRCLNLGLTRLMSLHVDRSRMLRQRQQRLTEFENHPAMQGNPRRQQFIDQENLAIDNAIAQSILLQTMMLSPHMLADASAFYLATAAWLVKLHQDNHPLLRALPEYVAGDIIEFFTWYCRYDEKSFLNLPMSELLDFAVAFLPGDTSPLRNPHLRGKLPDVLRLLVPEEIPKCAPASHVFIRHPGLRERLVASLLDLFTDVEFTGRSNQFYEKFQARKVIAELLEFLWLFPDHRHKFQEKAAEKGDSSSFVKFLNMLINDAVWLLDDSLKKLEEIREGQQRLADVQRRSTQSQQEQQSEEEELRQSEQYTSSIMSLANVGIRTLQYLSADSTIASRFVSTQFVSRMAEMLDYYMCLLVGPTVQQLNVQNPSKYNFTPRKLLADIISTFINLCSAINDAKEHAFYAAVAADARSYNPGLFAKAARIIGKFNLLPPEQLGKFQEHLSAIADAHSQAMRDELCLQNAPDEFLDPIMASIMVEPVKLPSSGNIMELEVIRRHWLNNPTDPFNRQPFDIKDLIPQPELKQRINDWISQQRQKATSSEGAGSNELMQTTQ